MFAFNLWMCVRARLFERTALAIMQYTLLLVLFGTATYKGVGVPFLAATLASEVFTVAFLSGKLQEMAGAWRAQEERRGGAGEGRKGGERRSGMGLRDMSRECLRRAEWMSVPWNGCSLGVCVPLTRHPCPPSQPLIHHLPPPCPSLQAWAAPPCAAPPASWSA